MTLAAVGHAGDVSMLDGGMNLWRSEERPVSTDVPPPAVKVAGQVFVSPKFVLGTMLVIVTVLVPTFVITTGCDALVVPCAWLPKVSDVGFAVTFALDKLPACTNTFESNAKSFASATASLM